MACSVTGCTVSSCLSGYAPSVDQLSCDEVDECLVGNGGCSPFAICTNLPLGSRTCTCNQGYTGNGTTCVLASLTDWQVDAFIKASNTGEDDRFGVSVSLSEDGNTLAVGAYWEDSSVTGINGVPNQGASNSGAVYVFTRNQNGWIQQAFIKASNPGVDDYFGYALSLSSDGNTLAVGAYREDTLGSGLNPTPNQNSTDSGAVYVFARLGSSWTQQAFLKASNSSADASFGFAVDLSADGNTLGVGAPDESPVDSGAVYVFSRTAETWTEQAFVKASGTGAGDEFGRSLSLSADGTTLAVGAANEDSSVSGVGGTPNSDLTNSGAAYVFTRTGNNWTEQAFIKASNPGESYWFGHSVSLSGDGNTLAVGARGEDSSTTGINGAPNEAPRTAAQPTSLFEPAALGVSGPLLRRATQGDWTSLERQCH